MVTPFSIESLEKLPSPNILVMPSFEEIKTENILLLKEVNEKYKLALEDDAMLPIIEAFAYRELHLRAMVNLKIKNMMPHYAEGADLDNFVWGFYGGLTRLKGAYPYANFRFSHDGSSNITLPEGTIVFNDQNEKGRLAHPLTLNGVTHAVVERVELLKLTETSDIELDRIDSFLPIKVEQITPFRNGAVEESDERFLERSILSLNRPSTAGAIGSYYYHILNAFKYNNLYRFNLHLQ